MIIEINVKSLPQTGKDIVRLEDLDLSLDEWLSLSKEEKEGHIKGYISDCMNGAKWDLESFVEI